jgi:regulator of protease activity HflC (stomatin/prohibitin superfamily)
MREIELKPTSGYLAMVLLLVLFASAVVGMARMIAAEQPILAVLMAFACLVIFVMMFGLFIVHPNEAKVLQLFGKYVGTVREPGLKYGNPFYSKSKVSVKVRNFETQKLKVNDSHSNPIEIGAVVVWKVVDTAEAVFDVDNYVEYVHVQSESALRALATNYPYDAHEEGTLSLSHNAAEVSGKLQEGVQERLARAGVEVMEARISHLAYAPEIASAMLQRQQASAVIAARQKIVEGAVGMVEMALADLSRKEIVHLDEERKAQMVSNLLVVLCSDRNAQPIVNAGSIY